MLNLQPLKELLKEAEGLEEVVSALEKHKIQLEQENHTLQARRDFLQKSVADEQKRFDDLSATEIGRSKDAAEAVVELDRQRKAIQAEVDRLIATKQALVQDFDTTKRELSDKTEQLRSHELELRDTITKLEADEQAIIDRSEALNNDIADRKKEFATLDERITNQQKEVTAELELIRQPLIDAQQQQTKLQKKIEDAEHELDSLAEKRAEIARQEKVFRDTQAQAKEDLRQKTKALESREQALIEREQKLQTAITRAQRNGIVGI